jgi:hypothetical protein
LGQSVRDIPAVLVRSVQETHEGRIWAGGVEKEVTFAEADRDIDGAIDAARCHGHGADSSGKWEEYEHAVQLG